MTTVYLIRHSKALKVNNDLNKDELQIQNEKNCLSIEGEELAKNKMNNKELKNIDILYSSNYVRAIQTAKYLADKNNLEINVISDLGERKFGFSSWDEKPTDFEMKQFLDENYKFGKGESQKEVRERMYNAVMNIVNSNKDKKIAIISHATATICLLKEWCDVTMIEDKLRYSFNNKLLLDGKFDYCEIIKIDFNDNEVVNIENIKMN